MVMFVITLFEKCFILTMRNLNLDKLRADLEGDISFILTMRNLNKKIIVHHAESSNCFILTMRNLNTE